MDAWVQNITSIWRFALSLGYGRLPLETTLVWPSKKICTLTLGNLHISKIFGCLTPSPLLSATGPPPVWWHKILPPPSPDFEKSEFKIKNALFWPCTPFHDKLFTNLGYFFIKGENGAPIMKKASLKVRGPSCNLYFHDNKKSMILSFEFADIRCLASSLPPPKICVSICQILRHPSPLECWHNMWTFPKLNCASTQKNSGESNKFFVRWQKFRSTNNFVRQSFARQGISKVTDFCNNFT